MGKILINSDSKFLSSFSFTKIKPTIHVDMSSKELVVDLELFSPNFTEELLLLEDALIKRLGIRGEYNFACALEEREKIVASINILRFKDAASKIVFANYELELLEKIIIRLEKSLIDRAKGLLKDLRKLLLGFGIEREVELVDGAFELVEPELSIEWVEEESQLLLGREFSDLPYDNEDLLNSRIGESVVMEGRVFGLNIIKRPKITIVAFNIDSSPECFSCKFFSSTDVNIEEDIYVRARAVKEIDSYTKEESYSIKDLMKINKKSSLEKGEERVEWHLHTKMSEMGSIIDVERAINRAKELGYNSLAITDSGVVHSFPDAYRAAKKHENFKVIFGMEGYIVDDGYIAEVPLEEYVVFDIETTGFNPYRDELIEIGAVKVRDGEITERFGVLINPGIEIPHEVRELTGITDEMVKNAEQSEVVLRRFLDFIGQDTLVAHNAEFDIGFISQKLKLLGILLENPYIDSLDISRALLLDNKKHGLKDLAKYFEFEFKHHRALDDAETTFKILKKFLERDVSSLKRSVKASFPNNILIYAKNRSGLKDLYDIVSHSHLENFRRVPKIPKSYLKERRSNLILGASFNYGELVDAYSKGKSENYIEELAKLYDFIEISPAETSDLLESGFTIEDVRRMIGYLVELGERLGIPVIATSNARYLDKNESLFIKPLNYLSNKRMRDREQYFRNSEDLIEAFNFLSNAREVVIENSMELAKSMEFLRPVPEGFSPPIIEGADEEVRNMTYTNARAIYGENIHPLIVERIEKELNSIINNGFAVLYLIAHKLVKKSLQDGYLVGSRGSVGSSLVAWLMNITEVNALHPHYLCTICKRVEFPGTFGSGVDLAPKDCCGSEMRRDGHGISFEVFMGFKGEKIPDIDLNFSGEYQPIVHKYVEEIFGKENVFRAGTISTLAKKNAFGYVKKYFEENGIEMSRAQIELYASKCENVRKTTGQHPGGLIILPKDRSILEFTPIQRPANDQESSVITTHFDYHVMDEQLVKLDILGHDDPTTLKTLEEMTCIDPVRVPLSDLPTLSIFNSTKALGVSKEDLGSEVGTFGIPEFGTPFARRMLADTRPSTFADLIRISGLSHGIDVWSNNAQNLIKSGEAVLSEVISVRDDIMNYLISKGIEKSEAFLMMEFIRKGLPLKDKAKWSTYEAIMRRHKIPEWYIESCSKITYIFPKGHAAAYVLMAVRIAYFKVHHPKAFYSSFLTRKAESFDCESYFKDNSMGKIKKVIAEYQAKSSLDVKEKNELYVWEILLEMKLRGIELLPIDLYQSSATKFTIEGEKIRVPFIVFKGLGESVAENIISERVKPFKSIEDLRKRTKIPKTVCDKAKELNFFDLKEMNQSTLF